VKVLKKGTPHLEAYVGICIWYDGSLRITLWYTHKACPSIAVKVLSALWQTKGLQWQVQVDCNAGEIILTDTEQRTP
jgi:hypothetical protein